MYKKTLRFQIFNIPIDNDFVEYLIEFAIIFRMVGDPIWFFSFPSAQCSFRYSFSTQKVDGMSIFWCNLSHLAGGPLTLYVTRFSFSTNELFCMPGISEHYLPMVF